VESKSPDLHIQINTNIITSVLWTISQWEAGSNYRFSRTRQCTIIIKQSVILLIENSDTKLILFFEYQLFILRNFKLIFKTNTHNNLF